MEHTIDATDKSLGRVATSAAIFLMGKDTPTFKRNVAPSVKVTITNVSKANISTKKMKEKMYQNYSGYPGGRKVVNMEKVIEKKAIKRCLERLYMGCCLQTD